MIKIRNEADLNNWFKKNYKKLGFEEIIRQDIGIFPDFIMKKEGKKIRVELEIKSSNFLMHKHSIDKVDLVICVKKDINLGIPTIELTNFKIIGYQSQTPYSLENQIYQLFNRENILTTGEVAKKLKIHTSTAQRNLTELFLQRKIIRIKKRGLIIWLKK